MAIYNTIEIVQESSPSGIFNLCLNNPSRRNALSRDFFAEFPQALTYLDDKASVIVLSGNGKHFCSGIDIDTLISTPSQMHSGAIDIGHVGAILRREIKFMQSAISAIEQCRKPVIAAIHGACIGGGVDIVTACDIRYCTEDAFFSVKEVDIGITADLGTLQRLPGIIGYGKAMELALTARRFSGVEAKELGLISKTFPSHSELNIGVKAIAEEIASKSPLAVMGTKAVAQRCRDLSIEHGLDYVATWNSPMLLSNDVKEALAAQTQRRKPIFAKL